MTHDDLATLLRDDLSRTEPLGLPDVAVPVTAGRSRVRRRRALSATLGAAALVVAAAVAVPVLGDGDGGDRVLDPAEQALADYDPQQMPVTLEQRAREVLGRSVPDLGEAEFRAGDGQGDALPPELYDKASGMSVRFGDLEHSWSVSLDHARSEAEGDPERYCRSGLREGYYLECTVETDDQGNVVFRKLEAMRPMSGTVNGEAAYMGVTADQLGSVNPDRLYFSRSVKVIKSETLVTYVQEHVRAPGLEEATALLLVPVDDLVELGADPALVIPEPPTDDSGCGPWTQSDGVTYSC
jgi:hypothetical protein